MPRFFQIAYPNVDIVLITLILATSILGVLSIYWACFCHVEQNLNSLQTYVVDFDGQVEPLTGVAPPLITRTDKEMSTHFPSREVLINDYNHSNLNIVFYTFRIHISVAEEFAKVSHKRTYKVFGLML